MVEFNRAIVRIRIQKPTHQLSDHFDENHMLILKRVPESNTFCDRYFIRGFPCTKAADICFFFHWRSLISGLW